MIASLVKIGDAADSDVKKIIADDNSSMMLQKGLQLDAHHGQVAAKILTTDAELVDLLRSDISELGFKGPYTLGIFAFAGWWPGGAARDVSHRHWKQMFCASDESFKLTRNFLVEKFNAGGKAVAVAEAIAQCKRSSIAN